MKLFEYNAIPITPWFSDFHDTALLDLLRMLDALRFNYQQCPFHLEQKLTPSLAVLNQMINDFVLRYLHSLLVRLQVTSTL